MFVRSRNFILSTLIHVLFFLLLLFYYRQHTSQLSLPVSQRVVSVHIDRIPRKALSLPAPPTVIQDPVPSDPPHASSPVMPPEKQAETASVPPDTVPESLNGESRKEIEQDRVIEPNLSEGDTDRSSPVDVPLDIPVPEEAPVTDFSYSYKEENPVTFDNAGLELPVEDFLIDDLLIPEDEKSVASDSFYTIELEDNNSRILLDTPELFLDLSDPVLGTLLDCRVRFTVSREGLVRDISMIPPGTGSGTYDEILENIVSRFVFSPGERENGVIGIQFSKFYGEAVD